MTNIYTNLFLVALIYGIVATICGMRVYRTSSTRVRPYMFTGNFRIGKSFVASYSIVRNRINHPPDL
ncbi:MAG: hypothetical protein A2W93_00090 [Bacteroidetes bacterium GWF2_43_63]|nr:MAG: hypothetical protein A2W94_07220 [Bacteroidetes bacterium GWE2_42_42]OFY54737.1 MAG: hypothetical protein A2W93_00090 [Bacteroidetes bacterium GWF2_43_63]HBG69212.1 hypothetical protein [Bacteroidales bacterium]HCB62517.1 hypothetical protein [Bacteroidales bacterium]